MRRAGPASATGVTITATAPALATAPDPNSAGSVVAASCQAGTAVSDTSAAV